MTSPGCGTAATGPFEIRTEWTYHHSASIRRRAEGYAMLERFYLIIDSAAWLPRLLPLGLGLVQIRVKSEDAALRRREIAASVALCKAAGAMCVVNDHWREAIDAGAEWVHLGQEDLDGAVDFPALARAGIRFGLSTANRDELDRALSFDPHHVALGPIWETGSKKTRSGPTGIDNLGQWRRIARRPVVAIGGITLERGESVFRAGADSLAVISDVLSNPDPERRLVSWLNESRSWKRAEETGR